MSREMKDSGVEWIGEIPEDWDVKRIKHAVVQMGSGTTPNSDNSNFYDGNIAWIQSGDLYNTPIITKTSKTVTEQAIQRCSALKIYHKPYIVIAMYGASVGNVSIASIDACTNQACCIIKPNDNNNIDYLKYWLEVCKTDFIRKSVGGGQPNISQDKVREQTYLCPSPTEQQQIVHFLDRKCTAIDTAIEKTKKSIEKLEEYKKAVITKAVTKGIDPNAKMKDSGVEWIGEIPENWEIRRIKTVGTYRNGLTYSPDDLTDETKGTLVLRSSNIKDGKLVLQDNLYVRTYISDKLRVQKGDILICSRNGSRALIGKNTLIDSDMDASFGAFMMIYRSKDPYYIHWVLKSEMMSYYLASFTTSTINQLIGSEFGNMYLPWPSNIQERQQISNYLNSKCSSIDALVTRKQETINKWEEYKKSLIYYAVTGKIDCRKEVIE